MVNSLPPGTSVDREPLLSRRGALQMGLTTAVSVGGLLDLAPREPAAAHSEAHSTSADITVNMRTFVQTRTFDQMVTSYMTDNHIPSAALAVLHGGKLAYMQGYGPAGQGGSGKATAYTRFRIASCSKQLTSVTILRLHEAGVLDLNATVFGSKGILKQFRPSPGAVMDPRLSQITVTHLLQHTAGWNRDITFDPMFESSTIASAMGVPAPAGQAAIIRYMLGRPLQADPGTVYNYSNFGYCVLGRVIETVAGNRRSYAALVRAVTLHPLGITRIVQGHTRLSQAAAGEAFYHQSAGDPSLTPSVFPGAGLVQAPYGAFFLEAMDSLGAWVASPLDLVRFLNAVSGRSGKPILSQASIRFMTARPAPPVSSSADAWYGMGWKIDQNSSGQTWWHNGALDGTASEVAIFDPSTDLQYAVVFSRLPTAQDWVSPMASALFTVRSWPLHQTLL